MERKWAQAKQSKDLIHHFPEAGRCSAISMESIDPSSIRATWEDKCHHFEHPLPPFFSHRLMCRAWLHMVWDIPAVTWGQLSCLCPFTPWDPRWWGGVRGRKGRVTMQVLLSSNENIFVLSILFWSQIQNTVSYQLLWTKLPLSKLRTACFLLFRVINKIMEIMQTATFLEDTKLMLTLIIFFF